MRINAFAFAGIVPFLVACGHAGAPADPTRAAPAAAAPAPAAPGPSIAEDAPRWTLSSGSEGAVLSVAAAGRTALRLACPPGAGRLRANVPQFAPVASEERLSLGQGGEVVALVADTSGDAMLGGVSADAPVPANLRGLLSGHVSASYGTRVSGPHPVPPAALVSAFVAACAPSAPDERATRDPQGTSAVAPVGACRMQDGRAIAANRLRAVGTEPFWGARIEGRCVTYSHPDAPSGTRVWTRFTGTARAGEWSGALDGKPFVLRTREHAGCSDGMSDTRYPIEVSLTVGGERRSGCAVVE